MNEYNTLNIRLSNSHLDKLKSGIKDGTAVILNLSSNVVGELMMNLISHKNYF